MLGDGAFALSDHRCRGPLSLLVLDVPLIPAIPEPQILVLYADVSRGLPIQIRAIISNAVAPMGLRFHDPNSRNLHGQRGGQDDTRFSVPMGCHLSLGMD